VCRANSAATLLFPSAHIVQPTKAQSGNRQRPGSKQLCVSFSPFCLSAQCYAYGPSFSAFDRTKASMKRQVNRVRTQSRANKGTRGMLGGIRCREQTNQADGTDHRQRSHALSSRVRLVDGDSIRSCARALAFTPNIPLSLRQCLPATFASRRARPWSGATQFSPSSRGSCFTGRVDLLSQSSLRDVIGLFRVPTLKRRAIFRRASGAHPFPPAIVSRQISHEHSEPVSRSLEIGAICHASRVVSSALPSSFRRRAPEGIW